MHIALRIHPFYVRFEISFPAGPSVCSCARPYLYLVLSRYFSKRRLLVTTISFCRILHFRFIGWKDAAKHRLVLCIGSTLLDTCHENGRNDATHNRTCTHQQSPIRVTISARIFVSFLSSSLIGMVHTIIVASTAPKG